MEGPASGRGKVACAALLLALAGWAGPASAGAADLPVSRARLYPKASREVWEAALQLADDLGFAMDRDKKHQSLVTWWQPFRRLVGEGVHVLPLADSQGLEELELHVFVSPFAEPARVYVDAVVMTGHFRRAKWVQLRYGATDISEWFFDRLEERLGVAGRAMPMDWAQRARLARELTGTEPCQPPPDSSDPPG